MKTSFLLEKCGGVCPVNVFVTDTGFSWSFYRDGLQQTSEIKVQQLLKPRIQSESDGSRLIVQYAEVLVPKKQKIQVRCTEVVFLGSYADCVTVKKAIEELVDSKESHRPKRVLIFINPKSGFQTAVKDYDAIVAPLMARCGVTVDAIVTKSENHAAEVLADYDLTSIDAVVSMGGDGSVVQVNNGLIRRTMNDHNADIDDPNVELIKPSLPFATIPGGSGCAVALMTTGTVMDIETCTLAIILGHRMHYDVIGARHEGKCVGFGNFFVGCGVISNVVLWLEKVKWLGKLRYWFVLPRSWWKWLNFDVEIDYLPVGCTESSVQNSDENDETIDGPWLGWKTLRCKLTEIWISKVDMTELGESLFVTQAYATPSLAPGKLTLNLIKGANFWQTMCGYRHLLGVDKTPRSYVQKISVTEARIRGITEWRHSKVQDLSILLDAEKGELRHGATFHAKIHPGLLTALALNRELVGEFIKNQPY